MDENTDAATAHTHLVDLDATMVTEGSDVTLMKRQTPSLVRLEFNIGLYADPVIVALGVLGNICSFLVLRRRSMRRSSFSIYFRLVAIIKSIAMKMN